MWRSSIAGLLLVVLILAAGWQSVTPAQSSAGSNLLHNPGFEAGPTGWTADPSTATFDIVSSPVNSGLQAASLTKTESGSWAFLYQDVAVTPGTHYSAQVWAVWNDQRLSNVKLRVEWIDGDGERVRLDETAVDERGPAYRLLLLEGLEAPLEAVTARVQGYTYLNEAGPDQPALFDDFHFAVTEGDTPTTPEPTSTATTTPTVVLPTPTPTQTPVPVPAGAVVINEVFYDPPAPGGDPDGEWVELYNTTERAIDLDGWTLADHIGEDALPALELPPRAFVVVAATDSFASLYPTYEGLLVVLGAPIGNGLSNSGDSLWLRDGAGREIDAMSYGDDDGAMFPPVPAAPEGYSLERVPAGHDTDTAADWVSRAVPSPGQGIGIQRLYLSIVMRNLSSE